MTANILYGEPLADRIKSGLPPVKARVVAISNMEDEAAQVYLRRQKKLCEKHGVGYVVEPIDSKTPAGAVFRLLERLNSDRTVTGISVHMPLPEQMEPLKVLAAMSPLKDIEAAHPHNLGMLMHGEHAPSPAAATAAVELARTVLPSMAGLDAVVVGRSPWVGRPLGLILLQSRREAPTVTYCHTSTRDLAAHTRRADVLFVAAGRAKLITRDMIKPGATVIDVGINAVDGTVTGDVDFEGVREVAAHLSPVPGGVGPVCLAVLLRNIAVCAQRCGGG